MPRPTAAVAVLAALALTGCGSWGRVGSQPQPNQGQTLTQMLDLTSVYRRLGRLTAGPPLPFVAEVGFFGGPGDSTVALMGLSLESRNLAFQKDGDAFAARYRVEFSATPVGGGATIVAAKDQTVRVGTFAETQRNDESVLYQDGLTLAPGNYRLVLQVIDQLGARTGRAEGVYQAPAFAAGTVSAPRLVYQSSGRTTRAAPLAIILNPRGTVAYGGDTAAAYVEAYGLTGPTTVPVVLRDMRDSVIRTDSLRFAGGQAVESALIRFTPDSAPLGELHIVVGSGQVQDSTIAVVSFSQGWVVTNFDDLVALLRYFTPSPGLDSLRKAPAAERGEAWKRFYHASDPNTATPANEALDQYFARLARANQRFRDEGVAGWRTDRGEVYIRLGEPDEIFDASPASEGRLIRWGYTGYQLVLYFVDETGFSRYRLTPGSRAELERVMARLSRQAD